MKNFIYKGLLVAAVVALAAACKKNETCSITLNETGVFVNDWGKSTTATFKVSNVKRVDVTSVTGGWTADVDMAAKTITVTAPESADAEDAAKTSSITLSAISAGGASSGAVLTAYVIDNNINLSSGGTSNCYVLTQPNAHYRFDATRKGESSERLATASVGIVWQSAATLVKYLKFDGDYADFYVGYNSAKDESMPDGNALIAAYDEAGTVIWSWHLWIASSDPLTEGVAQYSNGATFMGRNLGAYGNSDGSTDVFDIVESYGLYYQWGRKDPFLRPLYYDCERNVDELAYNSSGSRTYVTVEPTRGTMQYAISHPWIFMSSTSETNGDWLNGSNNNTLWGSAGSKSMYDPCPKGWQVPSKSDFACLELAEAEDNMDLEEARKIFGWHLTDKGTGSKYFYTGAGYRSYFDGILSNINYKDQYPYTPVPWVGYYWTNGTSGTEGVAMFFDLNTTRATINAFEPEKSEHRGNAMQIRCVKVK